MTKEIFFGIGYVRYLAAFAAASTGGRLERADFPYGPYWASFELLNFQSLLSRSDMRFSIDFGERQVAAVRRDGGIEWETEPNSAEIVAMALLAT